MKGSTITQAAQKAKLHPETLRRLERRGIISPRRDINGWRRYDLETIEKLCALYAPNETSKL